MTVEWPSSAPTYVRLDLFPAFVTRPGETEPYTDRARVIVTDQDFYIFLDSPAGPVCDFAGVLYDAFGSVREGYHAILEDESDYFVRRSANCGCGSRLRGTPIFRGVRYVHF